MPQPVLHSHSFHDLIWTVRADVEAGMLGVQVRNPEEKTAAFYLLDLGTGVPGPAIVLENGWWTELQAIEGNVLLIGRYGDPGLPVISEVVAVDGVRGEVVEGYVSRGHAADVVLPTYSLADGGDLEPGLVAGSSVAVSEAGSMAVRAWHGRGERGIELWLEVWEGDLLLLRNCLESGMEKLNPAPFFRAGRWLVFIRERRELCWVDV